MKTERNDNIVNTCNNNSVSAASGSANTVTQATQAEKPKVKMSEDKFYEMLDIIDTLPVIKNDYIPSVDVLKAHHVDERPEKFIPYLVYLSERYENKKLIAYKELSKFVNKMVGEYVA